MSYEALARRQAPRPGEAYTGEDGTVYEGGFVDGEMAGRGVRTGPGGKREGAVFSTGLLVSGRIEVSWPAELAQRRGR